MPYNYTAYVNSIGALAVVTTTDVNFQNMLPNAIDYGEQRIFRDLNLIANRVRDQTGAFTANSRTLALPSSAGTFVQIQAINVVTPFTATVLTGTRNSLIPAALRTIDFLYPLETTSGTSVPYLYAHFNQTTLIVGPSPDQNYPVEVIGTIRPLPLSASNGTTFLSQYLPDLFIAASMIFVSGYLQNFGQQSDNPQMAQSWEKQYESLLESAGKEEVRKKFDMAYSGIRTATPAAGGPV